VHESRGKGRGSDFIHSVDLTGKKRVKTRINLYERGTPSGRRKDESKKKREDFLISLEEEKRRPRGGMKLEGGKEGEESLLLGG